MAGRADALVLLLAAGPVVGSSVGEQLTRASLPGAIVLITDGVGDEHITKLTSQRAKGRAAVHVLAMVPEPGENLSRAAAAGGGSLVKVRPDDADVRRLASRTARDLAFVGGDESERWQDSGYWLVLLLLAPVLLWFRRGWTVPLG